MWMAARDIMSQPLFVILTRRCLSTDLHHIDERLSEYNFVLGHEADHEAGQETDQRRVAMCRMRIENLR